ncbi:MAG: DUF1848 domain-containing protein [Prosthecochloris sp.]|uniref:DUF1848 domain-containing protein n=1 Tax=Prosthecochloris aestuarii (strain DSM 271 / SK 413) TaxID=290512 RepID=B4S4J1_PROA2|nr:MULTISPECIES: DUF1848 domain-containing protein [Prosthecochloris]ACF46887.1 Domain of unknown function DUF1848 [Prosthecochloris aestuarii DSM 271]MCW8798432.1 DUF1848 domain-containing protein [Prosthecochloris sp.]NEX11491.1 DUF1848 domain-containing protein [Prosthecochloris sp.]
MSLLFGNDPQIISASRRTDIPAFYSQWFFNRLRDGYCRVQNPYRPELFKTVSLEAEDVAAIVFWTRYTASFREHIAELDQRGLNYFFHYTITGYPAHYEPGLPELQRTIEDFLRLSDHVGPDRVIWRYDPVMVTDATGLQWHSEHFARLAGALQQGTKSVIISFLQMYPHLSSRLSNSGCRAPSEDEKVWLAGEFSRIAEMFGLELKSCGRRDGVQFFEPGKCIDERYLRSVFSLELSGRKDRGQPEECRCIKSVDIGAYNSCLHGCRYCYAVRSFSAAHERFRRHRIDREWL